MKCVCEGDSEYLNAALLGCIYIPTAIFVMLYTVTLQIHRRPKGQGKFFRKFKAYLYEILVF